jgi:hypothetical protein
MYYLLNETNQIVAADNKLLKLCGVADVNELFSKMLLNKITFTPLEDGEITIGDSNAKDVYKTTHMPLSFLLGKLVLVSLSLDESKKDFKETEEPNLEFSTNSLELLELDDKEILDNIPKADLDEKTEPINGFELKSDELNLGLDAKKILDIVPKIDLDKKELLIDDFELKSDEINLDKKELSVDDFEIKQNDLDDETLNLLYSDGNRESEKTSLTLNESQTNDSELFSLKTEDSLDMPTQNLGKKTSIKKENHAPVDEIVINASYVSRKIGVSEEDYRLFLNEYVDTALSSEAKLKSYDSKQQKHTVRTLSHLAEVLHIPIIGKIISRIENSSEEKQSIMINSFYTTLSKLSVEEKVIKKPKATKTVLDSSSINIPSIDIPSIELPSINVPSVDVHVPSIDLPSVLDSSTDVLKQDTQTVTKAEVVKKPVPDLGLPTLVLDDVEPIRFDFLLDESAKDLSLPVSLIEEFVLDFIEQAREETPKMLAAYNKGDTETVEEIAHLLKGASSNLRINPLADTLYQIQYCEDPKKLGAVIKDYWGHFLSFENQIILSTKQ